MQQPQEDAIFEEREDYNPSPPQDGMRHKQNPRCMSNFGAMIYDPECLRCSKINKVIMLKRKTPANGCSQEETIVAKMMVNKIVEQYKLTRGEIFDREYDGNMIAKRHTAQKQYHNTYGSAKARTQPWNRRARPSGYRKMSGYNRRQDDDLITDEE